MWHADEISKSPDLFENVPEPGERLDGANLRGISIAGRDLLSDMILIGADFEKANLEGADLRGADLRDANFTGANAKGTNFNDTILEDTHFQNAKLQNATFQNAHLKDSELSGSRVNSKTEFDDTVIYERQIREEGSEVDSKDAFDAATWVYRHIQEVSRRNALFQQAEKYFFREKDLRRRFAWKDGNYLLALRSEGARWIMGYGRNPWRALGSSAVIVVVCALLFPFLGGLRETTTGNPITYSLQFPLESSLNYWITVFGKSLYFSVVTFATLGYGDIKPIGGAARALAGIETLVGFGLVALLISVLLRRGNWL